MGPDLFIGPSRTWQTLGRNVSSRQKAVRAESDGKAVLLLSLRKMTPFFLGATAKSFWATCHTLAKTRKLTWMRGREERGRGQRAATIVRTQSFHIKAGNADMGK